MWMVFLYYLTNFVLQPVTLGLFFNDLLTAAGLHAGVGTYCIGALLCCALRRPSPIVESIHLPRARSRSSSSKRWW